MRTMVGFVVAGLLALAMVSFGTPTSYMGFDSFNLGSIKGLTGSVFDIVPKSPCHGGCYFQ
jgi:hypothetical protein